MKIGQSAETEGKAIVTSTRTALLQGDALLLEDNMIIVMAAQDMLRDLGAADVHNAGSTPQALDLLDECEIRFALLDINLDGETSLAVAEHCRAQQIPVVLTTGYSWDDDVLHLFPKGPVLIKPYARDDLVRAIADTRATGLSD